MLISIPLDKFLRTHHIISCQMNRRVEVPPKPTLHSLLVTTNPTGNHLPHL